MISEHNLFVLGSKIWRKISFHWLTILVYFTGEWGGELAHWLLYIFIYLFVHLFVFWLFVFIYFWWEGGMHSLKEQIFLLLERYMLCDHWKLYVSDLLLRAQCHCTFALQWCKIATYCLLLNCYLGQKVFFLAKLKATVAVRKHYIYRQCCLWVHGFQQNKVRLIKRKTKWMSNRGLSVFVKPLMDGSLP